MVKRLLLSSQAGKTGFTRLVETASLLGTSLGQFASAGLREKGVLQNLLNSIGTFGGTRCFGWMTLSVSATN
ncbi:hypothetical protein AMECASPLE_039726 [Ameca splendens]|uniref:Uncharacterized protein n=1 Tax=Ameca splendens TaxID=208324 RepID=A0ABV0Z6E1_9TELE